jgi:hypothetical protein
MVYTSEATALSVSPAALALCIYSSSFTLVALKAYKTAGPGPGPGLPNSDELMTGDPLVVPLGEIEGVAPESRKWASKL